MRIMSNRRKAKGPRGTGRQDSSLRLVAGHGTGESPRNGKLHGVRSRTVDDDTRDVRRELPAIPETAARDIHVLVVSLHGAAPPPWRRLEVSSAITLDRLHEVLQETFGWSDFGPHSSGVMLAQAAGEEGVGIAYLYGYDDEWRVDILVEKIVGAAPGVAYPRCTGGQGEDIPDEGYDEASEFDVELEPIALDMYFDPHDLTEDLADLATVIITG
jgi:hypothetical protein